jgi:mannose-6-phosphate isomerase-like protein (cupin superfamily)
MIRQFVAVACMGGLLCVSQVTAESSAGGSIIEHDAGIAVRQPGPHEGGGASTAYPFFEKANGFKMVFRKRALHQGAAIGYHLQDVDEVYYILSGTGEFTLNGVRQMVGAGTAILTRPGNSHGLRQTGSEDLVLIISYLASG